MPILETLHDTAIEARDEYTALVLAEATGKAEERDPQSVRELLAIVGKSSDQLSRDIATAKQRHGAAQDCQRAKKLRAEVTGLQEEKRHLQAELKRVVEQADAMIRAAQTPLVALENRERAAIQEADGLWSRATSVMQTTGSSATKKAAAIQKQIDAEQGSVVIERHQLQTMGPGANKVVNELAPKIERLERIVKTGGPAELVTELAKLREQFDRATNTLTTLDAHRRAVEAADARVAELEAEKQAMLSDIPAWDAIDFFENTPRDSQRFGRAIMS